MHDQNTDPTASEPSAAPREPAAGRRLSRRRLIAAGAATGAATAVTLPIVLAQDTTPAPRPAADGATPAAGGDMAGMAMQTGPATNIGFTFLVPYQATIVKAAAARLIPTDGTGPGATEAGVVYFIDRQLTEEHAYRGYRGPRYDSGPFVLGLPTQGDQSGMSMRERFRLGIFGMDTYAKQLFNDGFASLPPDRQDKVLSDMERGVPKTFDGASLQTTPVGSAPSGTETGTEQAGQVGTGAKAFFDLLLTYTIAGFFADPAQGGNRDMVGWKLIGFPGAHVSWADQILNYGQPFKGGYISLGQYQAQSSGGA